VTDDQTDDNPQPKLLTLSVAQAARSLGISRNTAYECVRQGSIPSIRLGHRIVVPRKAMEALLDVEARAD
jgi:excisionase family DNA binding protein